MVPLYNNMGIRGHGKAESTVFYKTTNNVFNYKKNGKTVLPVDALAGFVPNNWDLRDSSMDSFTAHVTLTGCMFRRYSLTADNVDSIRPHYGLFFGKAAAPVVRQCAFDCAYIGCMSYVLFSGVMEMLGFPRYVGKGYCGVLFEDYRAGLVRVIGTSMDMRLVQVSGYQIVFQLSGMQYTTMTNCTAENCTPMQGETACWAFSFTNPYSIVINTCATEFNKGGQLRATIQGDPSFRPSLVVNTFQTIDQQNSVVLTPMISIDNGVVEMSVVFIGGDWAKQNLSNLASPSASGNGLKVRMIGVNGSQKSTWTITNLADVQEL
ncbi:hypothetical protein PGS49_14590 [Yersinia intermedia]|uniref:hypothetical protein n=1 Tax=Yersinia intermedia TaxID=631 RepID=UPI0011A3E618|nr:hypothetical protein [Yersinia intermedia]MCW8112790.1 hypothetical protein [Yersinia intermedia]MDA5481880.1 hypothetical protein [Yersinia intermedia]MDA5516528.1 hypothetical protein [Yersinia intermedia]